MPRLSIATTKVDERKIFAEVMESHIIAMENTIEVAKSKRIILATEKTLFVNAIKKLRSPIKRIR